MRKNGFCIIMAAAQNNSLKTSTIKAKRTVVFCLFFLRKILQNFEIQTNCETEAAWKPDQIFGRKRKIVIELISLFQDSPVRFKESEKNVWIEEINHGTTGYVNNHCNSGNGLGNVCRVYNI